MANTFFVATDLTAVLANIATVDTVVDLIRATDITTITNAITAKNIRGGYGVRDGANPGAGYVDLCNITGEGKLVYIGIHTDGTGLGDLIVTIDGVAAPAIAFPINQDVYICPTTQVTASYKFDTTTEVTILNIEYNTSLRIQYKNQAINFTVHAGIIEDP